MIYPDMGEEDLSKGGIDSATGSSNHAHGSIRFGKHLSNEGLKSPLIQDMEGPLREIYPHLLKSEVAGGGCPIYSGRSNRHPIEHHNQGCTYKRDLTQKKNDERTREYDEKGTFLWRSLPCT